MCLPIDSKRLAAIDVGSNSVKMLAADVSAASFPIPVCKESITVRLQDGLRDGALREDALIRAEDAIARLAAAAREVGAERVMAFGTSALRDAINGGELIARVREKCGVTLRIISGEEEAESAYIAAAAGGREIVVNPGGGSTEIVLGEDSRVLIARSAHIGAVSLLRMAGSGASARAEEIAGRAVSIAESVLESEWRALGALDGDSLVLSGGTVSCAATVLQGLREYDPSAIEGFRFRRADAEALMNRLFSMTIEERSHVIGLPANRADILPYGLAIFAALFRVSGRESARVTDRGNLYGFLLRMRSER